MNTKNIVWWGLMVVAILSALARAYSAGSAYGFSDFYGFYQSVLFFFSGQNIYSPVFLAQTGLHYNVLTNLNPPFLVLLFLPFHVLNYANAIFLWNIISMAAMLAGGYWVLRPFPQWHKHTVSILVLLFIFYPTVQSLVYGQLTGVLLLALAGAWLWAREKQDAYAGVCIGFACAIKLFCGLFLVYFLCLHRFRVLWVALFVLLLSIVSSGLVFGFHAYFSFYANLKNISWYTMGWNASMKGYLMRVFSSVEGNVPFYEAALWAKYLLWVLTAGVLIALITIWRREGSQDFDRGFSLVIVGMLLLSPLGWMYYFPLLLIPYLVIVAEKNDWVHLAACFLLLLSTKFTGLMEPKDITTPLQIFWQGGIGFYVLAGLFLLLVRPYATYERFSPALWTVIYGLIFLPALAGLFIYSISIMFTVHHLGLF